MLPVCGLLLVASLIVLSSCGKWPRTLESCDGLRNWPRYEKTRFGCAVAGLEVVEPMELPGYSVNAPCPRACIQHMHIGQTVLLVSGGKECRPELMERDL